MTEGAPLFPLIVLFGLNAVDELDRTAFNVLTPEIRDHFNLKLTPVLAIISGDHPRTEACPDESDFFASDEYAMRLRVVPTDLSLPVETRGRVFVTLFYVDPAPPGWSLVGGST